MINRAMLDYVMARIRPQIQADGGDVKVTEVNDAKGIVYISLLGACVGCPLSALTLSQGIERVLCEHVPGVKEVRPDPSQSEAMMSSLLADSDPRVQEDEKDLDETAAAEPSPSDRFGDPVRVTRLDEDGTITHGTMPLGR